MRRIIYTFFTGLACCLSAGVAGAEGPALSANDLPVESLAQRTGRIGAGWFRPRGSSQQGVRQYRSYSVVPGEIAEEVQTMPQSSAATRVLSAPPPQPGARSSQGVTSGRSSSRSKPSYLRADSKARGNFSR